ncbi:MAG: sulfur carrier protein ThiS [Candidatus Latescibacterota bacterium]|nr:MAG: sulfur carrier protein ThiS [Candidatus Latescibacterota bacterium]
MQLTINGEKKDVDDVRSLEDLLTRLDLSANMKGVAVAVNDTVVPKIHWKTTRLEPGDVIEVIHAVQGG